jgi:lipid II:glycine glycyltransferase (peptidoglycan interpeptide bridge formation enzyme)
VDICSLNEESLLEWNAFVEKEPTFPLLQSWEWGSFKEKLGWRVNRVAVKEKGKVIAGAQLLIKPLPLGLSLGYVPRGPIGSWRNPEVAKALLPELCRIARDHGAIFLKIEPPVIKDFQIGNLLEEFNFHRSKINNQPQATILLDLAQKPGDILLQMRKKTRQYIHRAEREGITVRFGNQEDLPAYHNLMQLTGKREHFAPRSLAYYQSEWETLSANDHGIFLIAYYQDQLIAARVAYFYGSHAAEFHAGSVVIPGIHPNYLLVWEAVKWAHSKGCTTYDLWGIPDEIGDADDDTPPVITGRDDGLWGVYQFKRGFSKNVVSYIGAYDFVLIPSLYALFNSVLFTGKWWEAIAAVLDSLKFNSTSKVDIKSYGESK